MDNFELTLDWANRDLFSIFLGILAGILMEIMDAHPQVLSEPAPTVDVLELAESSVNPQIAKSLRENIKASIVKLSEFVRSEQERGVINSDLDQVAIAQVLWAQFMGMNVQTFIDRKINIDNFASVVEAILNGQFSIRLKGSKR